MKVEAGLDITSESHIRVFMSVGVDKAYAGTMSSADELCEQMRESMAPEAQESVGLIPREEANYYSCEMSSEGPVKDFYPLLTHAAGVWDFQLDARDLGSDVNKRTVGSLDELKISVTFPGKVLTHNGSSEVSGHTVTWTSGKDLVSPEGLRATASDNESDPVKAPDPARNASLVAGVAALVLLGALVYFFVIAPRRKKARIAAAIARSNTSTPPSSQGRAEADESEVDPEGGLAAYLQGEGRTNDRFWMRPTDAQSEQIDGD